MWAKDTYILIKIVHALLVCRTVLSSSVAPWLVGRNSRPGRAICYGGGQMGRLVPCVALDVVLLGRRLEMV